MKKDELKVNRKSEFWGDGGEREAEYKESFWEYIKLRSL